MIPQETPPPNGASKHLESTCSQDSTVLRVCGARLGKRVVPTDFDISTVYVGTVYYVQPISGTVQSHHCLSMQWGARGEWTFFAIMEAAFGMHAQQFSGGTDSCTTQRLGCKSQVSLVSH